MLSLKRQKKTTEATSPFVPSGLIAQTEKGFFYIKGQKRFKFVSDRARDSWGLKVVKTKESYIPNIKLSGIIGFRDGTLIKNISTSKLYLISDNLKRHIASPDVLTWLGYNKNDIIVVSNKEAAVHKEGDSLNG